MPTWMIEKRVGDLLLVGYSVAGVESVVAAPELNVCFDIGRAPAEVISLDTVCLSHGHMDHSAGVAYYFSQRTFIGNAPGRVLAPRRLAQPLQALMAVWADIEGHPSPGQIVGVEPGEDVPLRRDLFIRPFGVNHGAQALGYAVVEARHKLKPEYLDLSGPQLVELKRRGEVIERRIEVPLVAYCGDTALGKFLELDHVRNARVLLIECTFYERDHLSRAREGRHIHACDLRELVSQVRSPHIVLTHVSQRTDLRFARQVATESMDETDLPRISFLMERPPRRERDRPPKP